MDITDTKAWLELDLLGKKAKKDKKRQLTDGAGMLQAALEQRLQSLEEMRQRQDETLANLSAIDFSAQPTGGSLSGQNWVAHPPYTVTGAHANITWPPKPYPVGATDFERLLMAGARLEKAIREAATDFDVDMGDLWVLFQTLRETKGEAE